MDFRGLISENTTEICCRRDVDHIRRFAQRISGKNNKARMFCFIRRFLSIQKLKLAFEAPHDQRFLRDVRLVSKRLSDTVTPILSSLSSGPGQRFNHITMALATEDVSIFRHVKELLI
jgi:hypothetical protein